MNTASFSFGVIIICSVSTLPLAKPFLGEEKNFGEEKLRCMDSAENSEYEKNNNQNSFNDFYNKPAQTRLEGPDKFVNRPFEYPEKRSVADDLHPVDKLHLGTLQKRQVGVVYKDEKPIGILQPFHRSYRFIPVNEENSYDLGENQNLPYIPQITTVDKRETNSFPFLDDSYPSILTNFKIGNKLDKKRNFDALTDENVRDLKTTIRRLRSSNSQNTEQIENELKNILNDMGLIEDEESHAEKREALEDPREEKSESKSVNERNKRAGSDTVDEVIETSNKLDTASPDVKKRAIKNDEDDLKLRMEASKDSKTEINRQKRQKQATSSGAQLIENLKDSGDLMVSGNKSPLASASEIATRDVEADKTEEKVADDEEDYEKRVERQIQKKINNLKEEVKREIDALKEKQTNEDEAQRKKRQAPQNLIDEEKEELNPVKNIDHELKPLIRKRRSTDIYSIFKSSTNSTLPHSRKKRDTDSSFDEQKVRRSARSSDIRNNEKKYNVHRRDDVEDGDNLLGDDFENSGVAKRAIEDSEPEYRDVNREDLDEALYERDKRSRFLPSAEIYDRYLADTGNYYYDDGYRYKRQNDNENYQGKIGKRFASYLEKPRLRRRINEDQALDNRPQQLSDMSDLDLFGALPKSYSGELSRYKRVKRK